VSYFSAALSRRPNISKLHQAVRPVVKTLLKNL